MDGFPARFSRGFACIPFVKYDFYFAGRFVWCRPRVVRDVFNPSVHTLCFFALLFVRLCLATCSLRQRWHGRLCFAAPPELGHSSFHYFLF